MQRARPHRAILFDLFDTLCRIDEAIYLSGKAESARLLGVNPEAYLRVWIAAGDRSQTGILPDVASRIRSVSAELGVRPDEGTIKRVEELEVRALRSGTSLHADARPALEAVRALPGLKMALVSNASSTGALVCEWLGLAPFFDQVVFSFQVGVVKPHPAIYQAACRSIGVAPEDCLFVGDGNGGELDGAGALGMTTVRIERPVSLSPYRKGESDHYDFSVDDLTRIVSLIRT